MEEFAQIHGKDRMLLIQWSGYEMAEDSLTYKDHLETDYTGLQAQLTRRRTTRSSHRQDRYSKSILACKFAPVGVKNIRRLDTLGLDPIRTRWKKGTEDDQTYHEWRMTHPGIRRALDAHSVHCAAVPGGIICNRQRKYLLQNLVGTMPEEEPGLGRVWLRKPAM